MLTILKKSILTKVVGYCLFFALLPAAVVGYLSFSGASKGLQEAQLEKLGAARDLAAKNILDYLETAVTNSKFLAGGDSVQEAFELFSFYATARESQNVAIQLEVDSDKYLRIVEKIDPLLKRWVSLYEPVEAHHDLLAVVGSETGHVSYSVKRGKDFNVDLKTGSLKDRVLAKLFDRVGQTQKPAVSDFSFYEPIAGPAAFVGVPVIKEGKGFLGMLALRIGPEKIDSLMAQTAAIGKTGNAFIVGQDLLMRSNARGVSGAIMKTKVDTTASRDAIAGKKGIGEIGGNRGQEVLTAWSPVGLKSQASLASNFDWGIIVNVDAEEAFAPVSSLGRWILLLVPATGLLVGLVGITLMRPLTRIITDLAARVRQLSAGDLTVQMPETKRSDEVGFLITELRNLVETMRSRLRQVSEGINVISTSTAGISSTVSELTQNVAMTSSSVAETVTTVEQVKQAALMASETAKEVARSSHRAVEVSQEGRQATEVTIDRMGLIKLQMQSIAETVVMLSEHSESIEKIIETVKDLAHQSNLLAVNASIEAARAGEQGKGFAVVAHEIKNLSDQSDEATAQVRTLLMDTRTRISAVVSAAEHGSQAVEAGVQQSNRAGEAIHSLAETVARAAQAARMIEATSEQQTAGVSQVAQAMANIEAATHQNSSGMEHIQDATKRLDLLASQLERLIGFYVLEKKGS